MSSASAASALVCGNAECNVDTTGVCMEGHSPAEGCPLIDDPDVNFELDDEPEAQLDSYIPPISDALGVHLGEALSETDIRDFLRWRSAKRIAILGDLSSGKTTLMCALWDRYLRGPFADMSFVGSHSLVALEQLSHHSRELSGGVEPDTKRTSIRDGVVYYHLAIAPTGNPDKRVDLMLSDRAGEVYHRVRDNSASAQDLTELNDVDRVVILLDGARVAHLETWANATHGVRQLLRGLLDGGALSTLSNVQIVTTKFDLVRASVNCEEVERRLEMFTKSLLSMFSHRLGSLSFSHVAARPADMLSLPAGLEELLVEWVKPRKDAMFLDVRTLNLNSEFDRILLRTPLS